MQYTPECPILSAATRSSVLVRCDFFLKSDWKLNQEKTRQNNNDDDDDDDDKNLDKTGLTRSPDL